MLGPRRLTWKEANGKTFKEARKQLSRDSRYELGNSLSRQALRIAEKGRGEALKDSGVSNLAAKAVDFCVKVLVSMTDRASTPNELWTALESFQKYLTSLAELVEQLTEVRPSTSINFGILRRAQTSHSRGYTDRLNSLCLSLPFHISGITALIRSHPRDEHGSNMPVPIFPPPPPRFFGRREDLETVVELLTSGSEHHDHQQPFAHVAILGAGGIGKSSLALKILHDQRVWRLFQARRFFIRCDAANTGEGLLAAIATEIGLAGAQTFVTTVPGTLSKMPNALIVLDNFETPWQQSRAEVELVLQALAAIPTLGLVVTMRGIERPLHTSWTPRPRRRSSDNSDYFSERTFVELRTLDLESARKIFIAISPEHASDPLLDGLLAEVDCLPLAVTLLAHVAQGQGLPTLDTVVRRFREQRTSFVNDGSGNRGREGDLEASIELSLICPRMRQDPSALQFLSVLAQLPDGLAVRDIAANTPPEQNWEGALFILRKTSLVYNDGPQSTVRIRVLAPIRMYMDTYHPPSPIALKALQDRVATLARFAKDMGKVEGLGALELVRPEIQNVQAIIERELSQPAESLIWNSIQWAVEAAVNLTHLLWYSGLGTTRSLDLAAEVSYDCGQSFHQAECLSCIGFVASGRADYKLAELSYKHALDLYVEVQDVPGQAECLRGLGYVSNHTAKWNAACGYFQKSIALFEQMEDGKWGKAECVKGLAVVADSNLNPVRARMNYEEARRMFTEVRNITGEADCIRGSAFTDLKGGSLEDLGRAFNGFTHALELFKQVGKLSGEADCLRGLGLVALKRQWLDAARVSVKQAVDKYRSAGNAWKRGQCVKGLGDAAVGAGDGEEAIWRFTEALELLHSNQDDLRECQAALEGVLQGV